MTSRHSRIARSSARSPNPDCPRGRASRVRLLQAVGGIPAMSARPAPSSARPSPARSLAADDQALPQPRPSRSPRRWPQRPNVATPMVPAKGGSPALAAAIWKCSRSSADSASRPPARFARHARVPGRVGTVLPHRHQSTSQGNRQGRRRQSDARAKLTSVALLKRPVRRGAWNIVSPASGRATVGRDSLGWARRRFN
jgi:hypothetical protein